MGKVSSHHGSDIMLDYEKVSNRHGSISMLDYGKSVQSPVFMCWIMGKCPITSVSVLDYGELGGKYFITRCFSKLRIDKNCMWDSKKTKLSIQKRGNQ